MVAIAIDFKKAYDSIKRETMVQILKELRIDCKIIDFIVRIYREDSTKIQLDKNKEIEIEVTSCIRHNHIQYYRRNEKNGRNTNIGTKNYMSLLRK